jgi:hypothetical protein
LLNSTDVCYHIREYTRRGGFGASPTNNLISNLKKKPSKIQTNPREAPWKENAIGYCAQALQRMMNRPWIDGYGTLVPVPCSKIAGHPDHDDRLMRVLQRAFAGSTVDIRPLLTQSCSTTADHETSERQRFEELLAFTRVDEAIVGIEGSYSFWRLHWTEGWLEKIRVMQLSSRCRVLLAQGCGIGR